MDVDGEMNHDTFFNPIMLNLVSEVVHRCAFLSDFLGGTRRSCVLLPK